MSWLRQVVEPPHFREGTWEEAIWNSVTRQNEYRLPESFAPEDVIIDLGCHIGGFSFACLHRGAGKVFSFEASPANYATAVTNLSRFGSRAEVSHAAMRRSDRPPTTMRFTSTPSILN